MKIIKKVAETILKYKLCNKKQKILVAMSGGKDSAVVTYILKKLGYNVEGFYINLGLREYSEKCEEAVKKLCENLKIKLTIYNFKKENGNSMCYIRSAVQEKNNLKNCAICGVLKKWIINKEARKLKIEKITTGHHLDDEAQTFFLNVLKGALELSSKTGPITKNKSNKKFIPRIKPLFFIFEKDIEKFARQKKLPVVYEKCPCAIDSYRIQVRKYFKNLKRKQKINIINNFLDIQKNIKKSEGKINYCLVCGEPCRGKICKRCELLKLKN